MSQTIQNESLYTLKPGVTPYIEPRPTSAVLRLSYCSISKHRPPKSVNETTPFGSTNRLQNGFNLSDFWQQGDRSTPFRGECLTLKWVSNVSRIICKHETCLYIYNPFPRSMKYKPRNHGFVLDLFFLGTGHPSPRY